MGEELVTKDDMITTINSIVDNTRKRNLTEGELSECVYYLALTVKYMLDK